jgi:trehalose 6-phosphate phosphatase
VRPPVEFDKGRAVRKLVERASSRAALFAGDDTTDLDAFEALRRLQEEGALKTSILVGVRSDEGPPEIVERADLVVDGVDGFTQVLAALARP